MSQVEIRPDEEITCVYCGQVIDTNKFTMTFKLDTKQGQFEHSDAKSCVYLLHQRILELEKLIGKAVVNAGKELSHEVCSSGVP